MSDENFDAVRMRNILLVLAGLCQLVAILAGWPVGACLVQPQALLAMASIVFGAFTVALGIKVCANDVLDELDSPWYSSPNGLMFLIVLVLLASAVTPVITALLMRLFSIQGSFPFVGQFFQSVAFIIAWSAILDWPRDRSPRYNNWSAPRPPTPKAQRNVRERRVRPAQAPPEPDRSRRKPADSVRRDRLER